MTVNKASELLIEFQKRGFFYNKDLLFNYYLSLITKPFVILTGISGSGKSKIAEIFAEIISDDEDKNYELVPVKPNWRDSKGLFGYHNIVDGSYYLTPTIKLFIRALRHPNTAHFLILDEMNIAKTEHYFSDYLSLIESRRIIKGKLGDSITDLASVFTYPDNTSLSEAIILSALDINMSGTPLKIEQYRNNRFSELWKQQIFGGENWTAQYRSELNQGDGRLAHRVFEGGNGEYKLKDKNALNAKDRSTVERLEKLYSTIVANTVSVKQDNMVLHNCSHCIDDKGHICPKADTCPFAINEQYKCADLYNKDNGHYYVPSELPIPMNVFTVGTVNVDETTYMFSPKVLDRSNVIEFNDVDFISLYKLTDEQKALLNNTSSEQHQDSFYFDADKDIQMPSVKIPTAEHVNRFSSVAPDQFNDLIHIFAALRKFNMHFGYRVMNEISLYMCNVFDNTSYSERNNIALDNQICQKILPKIFGSYDRIWSPLTEVLRLTLKEPSNKQMEDINSLSDFLSESTDGYFSLTDYSANSFSHFFKYPRSASKIISMLKDLDQMGFTTFIK